MAIRIVSYPHAFRKPQSSLFSVLSLAVLLAVLVMPMPGYSETFSEYAFADNPALAFLEGSHVSADDTAMGTVATALTLSHPQYAAGGDAEFLGMAPVRPVRDGSSGDGDNGGSDDDGGGDSGDDGGGDSSDDGGD